MGLSILGSQFVIQAPDEEWRSFLELMWRPFVGPPKAHARAAEIRPDPAWGWELRGEDEILGMSSDRWFLAAELRYWLVANAVEAGGMPLLHASVVSRDDRALVAMADSGGGKTTLSLALIEAGWAYHGDDLAMIDPATLHVTAFPTPAGIRDPARWTELGERWEGAAPWPPKGEFLIPAPGFHDDARSLPVGALAFLEFTPGAAPEIEEVSAAEATAWCASQMGRRTEDALSMFARLCRATPRVRLRYGSSEDARALVARLWERGR